MPDKMKFQTPDLTAENVAKLAALFPSAVAEGKVNIDLLRAMLGEDVFTDEAYEFTWVGKRAAIAEAGRPIRKTLRPAPSESKDWDTTENLYIEGDNLDVLKLLQESYLGKVKMIYIDPPYNTGSDFVYRDNFAQSREEYDEEAGVYDEDGDRLFRNTESNGRFHSDWCSMIYPRLVLARNLLRDDGAVFISCDDNEVDNLRKMCDEVFGAKNFISQVIVQTNPRGRTFDRFIAKTHEYIIVYVNKIEFDALREIPKDEKAVAGYQKEDGNGKYRLLELRNRNPVFNRINRPLMFYPFYADPEKLDVSLTPTERHTVEIYPRNSEGVDGCWTWGLEKATNEINLLVANLANTGKWSVFRKDYLEGTSLYTKAKGLWLEKEMNHENGKEMVRALFGATPFDFPKSVDYIKKCLLLGTSSYSDDIVLDFFSGSATTAHAVMQLNAEDGGKRKFIMVQLPEVCAEGTEAAKAGYANICEIGKERIRRAGDKIKDEAGLTAQGLDVGFRVLKLADTNMNDVYYAAGDYTQDLVAMMEGNIKADRTDMDLLFGCLLDWGLPLSMPHTHEVINGFTVHTYNGGDLIACFEEKVPESVVREIASRKPLRAVFRDSGFESSPQKINVFEIFKLLAPNTNVRVI